MEKFVDYMLLGKRIKEARKKTKMTQDQLAEKLGISTAYMSQIETGKATVNLNRLAQIAFLLQTDISYFLSGVTSSNQYLIGEFNSLLSDRTPEELNLAYRVLNELLK